jgi:hypothetical protein
MEASIFTTAQTEELAILKSRLPFRIVWGAVNTQTEPHTFEAHADYDRRRLMRYLRKGWLVATVER